MAMVRWRPARDVMNVQDEMNRLFDRFFDTNLMSDRETTALSSWYPTVDISENKDEFTVTAELPGLKKNDIHISFKEGMLIIEGERKAEKEQEDTNYHRVERSHGKFCRSFQLPGKIEHNKIDANYKDGVLTIHMPKAEETKPKEIDVKIS